MKTSESISVTPLYIAVLRITDSKKYLTWEQHVCFGTDFNQAVKNAYMAAQNDWLENAIWNNKIMTQE